MVRVMRAKYLYHGVKKIQKSLQEEERRREMLREQREVRL